MLKTMEALDTNDELFDDDFMNLSFLEQYYATHNFPNNVKGYIKNHIEHITFIYNYFLNVFKECFSNIKLRIASKNIRLLLAKLLSSDKCNKIDSHFTNFIIYTNYNFYVVTNCVINNVSSYLISFDIFCTNHDLPDEFNIWAYSATNKFSKGVNMNNLNVTENKIMVEYGMLICNDINFNKCIHNEISSYIKFTHPVVILDYLILKNTMCVSKYFDELNQFATNEKNYYIALFSTQLEKQPDHTITNLTNTYVHNKTYDDVLLENLFNDNYDNVENTIRSESGFCCVTFANGFYDRSKNSKNQKCMDDKQNIKIIYDYFYELLGDLFNGLKLKISNKSLMMYMQCPPTHGAIQMSNIEIHTNYNFYINLHEFIKEGHYCVRHPCNCQGNHTKRQFNFSIKKYDDSDNEYCDKYKCEFDKGSHNYVIHTKIGSIIGNSDNIKHYIHEQLNDCIHYVHPIVIIDYLSMQNPTIVNEYFQYIDSNENTSKDEFIKKAKNDIDSHLQTIKNQQINLTNVNDKLTLQIETCEALNVELIKKDIIIDKLTSRLTMIENKYAVLIEQLNN